MKCFYIGCLVLLSAAAFSQKVGINTPAPTEPLDVNGNVNFRNQLKLNGNPGTAGQVITSNGTGDPVWMNTAYSNNSRFFCTIANNSKTSNSNQGRGNWSLTSGTFQFDSVDFQLAIVTGTDITVTATGETNNFIEANVAGLYHFEGTMRYFLTAALSVDLFARATLSMMIAQPGLATQTIYLEEAKLEKTGGAETSVSTNQFNLTAKFSINIPLKQGSTIAFLTGFNNLRYPGGTDLIAIGISTGGYISGHLIAE